MQREIDSAGLVSGARDFVLRKPVYFDPAENRERTAEIHRYLGIKPSDFCPRKISEGASFGEV